MNRRYSFLAAVFTLIASSAFAQDDGYLHCGTTDVLAKVFAEHPDIKADYEAQERQGEVRDAIEYRNGYHTVSRNNTAAQSSAPDYIIPVVFHIIHQYGYENISDAQIYDEMNILNRDYRLLNADTSQIVDGFDSIMADTKIEFRLANIDPNGNCTNGIDRIYSPLTVLADDNSKLNPWPRNKYLNVWVVKSLANSGASAYAYLPGTAPSAAVDGVIILNDYVGSIGTSSLVTSRTLTHECGHFFNLQHVWGNTNNPGIACGDDGVSDTPVTKGYTYCTLSNLNMVCDTTIHENVQNYMEYSFCNRMFTQGQKARMTAALNSGIGQRNQLWTAANLTATGALNSPATVCAPTPDFLPITQTMVCAGGSVTFTDHSFNGHPTSWNWTFPGGAPSTSTDSIPVIQYNTPGVYDATLSVTNAAGTNTITRSNIVRVSATMADYSIWAYSESFENASTFNSDYIVLNPSGNGWSLTNAASYTGNTSCMIANSFFATGQVDELVSPSVDFSAISGGPTLTFKVAFARHTTADMDKLRMLVSTDCGHTWTQRWLKSGSTLATVSGTQSSNFYPAYTQWRTETVNLNMYASNTNVRLKFEFTSEGGNNIFIDDINIQGTNGIDAPEAGINNFSIVPNPATENANVIFSLDHTSVVTLQLADVTGRVVEEFNEGTLSGGEQQLPLNIAELSNGIYFIRISTSEGKSAAQKLVIGY